jgi:hypothetical protein
MENIELNLEIIARISKRNEDENIRFRTFLKSADYKKIDKIVHRIYLEVIEHIDCTECANCCVKLGIVVTNKEIKRLSEIGNLSQEDYESKFIDNSEFMGEKILKVKPCMYLENKKCTIYEDRPIGCKDYPHVHKNEFNFRTLSMIDNCGSCPIVFNVLERLKDKFRPSNEKLKNRKRLI